MSIGQIMAECDCTHEACEARGYCMATRIAELEEKNPPEEHCAKCGAPKSNHPYRHAFVSRATLSKGEG